MKLSKTRPWLLAIALLPSIFCSPLMADFVVEISDAEVDLSARAGTVQAAFDIIFSNPTQDTLPIAGYTLFLDIAPQGQMLPNGVAFASDPATYLSGIGAGGPMFGASLDGTKNLDPAAGDIGLGQLQFVDGQIQAGESFTLVRVNLEIDLAVATEGDFQLFLNPDGQSSISSLGFPNQTFTSTPGTLSLVAVPEPGAAVLVVALAMMAANRRRRQVNISEVRPVERA